jgi:hypothetical protein
MDKERKCGWCGWCFDLCGWCRKKLRTGTYMFCGYDHDSNHHYCSVKCVAAGTSQKVKCTAAVPEVKKK